MDTRPIDPSPTVNRSPLLRRLRHGVNRKWRKLNRPRHLTLPKMRLYQQIILYFLAVVFIPLLGVSFLIYNNSQLALRRELGQLTQWVSGNFFESMRTELGWYQHHAQSIRATWLANPQANCQANQPDAVQWPSPLLWQWSLYRADGSQVCRVVSPLPILPDPVTATTPFALPAQATDQPKLPPSLPPPSHWELSLVRPTWQIVQRHNPSAQSPFPPFALRMGLPLSSYEQHQLLASSPDQRPVLLVLDFAFPLLDRWANTSANALFERLMLVNAEGQVIVSSDGAATPSHPRKLSSEALALFKATTPGVREELAVPKSKTFDLFATANSQDRPPFYEPHPQREAAVTSDNPQQRPLKRVMVKLPEVGWGLIIESPYTVKYGFLRRANSQTFLLILACFGIVIAFTLFYVLGLNRNMRQLVKGIKAYTDGRYTRRIRLITNWFTPSEIVYLTGEFNRMGRRIGESWHQQARLTDALQQANANLAKLDELKSNLIDTVSHELRTPLTSIKGYSSRLIRLEGQVDSETRIQHLKTIKQQADRLTRMVDDLLAIHDVEHGQLRVFLDTIDPVQTLHQSVRLMQRADSEKDSDTSSSENDGIAPITLTLSGTEDSPLVLADPDRLAQVFHNLLENAQKYGKPLQPITVVNGLDQDDSIPSALAERLSVPYWWVCVENVLPEGHGLTAKDLPRLFEKFYRHDDSMTRTTRGTGLGLFICKGLVQAMGGEMTVWLDEPRDTFAVGIALPLAESLESLNDATQ